jgi:hypothetical protein
MFVSNPEVLVAQLRILSTHNAEPDVNRKAQDNPLKREFVTLLYSIFPFSI